MMVLQKDTKEATSALRQDAATRFIDALYFVTVAHISLCFDTINALPVTLNYRMCVKTHSL